MRIRTFTQTYFPEDVRGGGDLCSRNIDMEDHGPFTAEEAAAFLWHGGITEFSTYPDWTVSGWYSSGTDELNYITGECREVSAHLMDATPAESKEVWAQITSG